ncbi:MAG: hypothetical protein LBP52_04835 [Burkholderiaceae bacterium]|jgi:hypothetical protein|nr:hypothetical protein [Burkholderiaceae bacterium]
MSRTLTSAVALCGAALCAAVLGGAALYSSTTTATHAAPPKASAPAAQQVSGAQDRSAVALTIYNERVALVREERTLQFGQGVNRVALREVSAKIKPETASLRSLDSGAPLFLLEQNFDFDLITPEKLLDKHVGETVTVVRPGPAGAGGSGGGDLREDAKVLANNSGVVLQYADRIETGLPAGGRIFYKTLPANLRDRPTLVVDLQTAKPGARKTELSYLSDGFDWKADYVATLAQDEHALDLAGWVTLTNQSGVAYENALLQLVAGDVNSARDDMRRSRAVYDAAPAAMMAPKAMEREELFEYHLYTLARPTTLLNQQTKQVALLNAAKVPVRKEYRMQGAPHWYHRSDTDTPERGEKRQVEVFVEFDNKGGDLGQPMPKGIVRVYKSDSHGRAQFIGEDRIDHTPKNENVRLKLGKSFDITGVWKSKNFRRISDDIVEREIQVTLKNAKDIPVTVRVVEPVPGQWEMRKENYKHQKTTANTATWDVSVPANGEALLEYQVRYHW